MFVDAFTQRSSGKESFHQLNTFTVTTSVNGNFVFIIFIDTHTHTQARIHRCIKINALTHEACDHAIPCVCTITEEVNLTKGQRTPGDSWECIQCCAGALKEQGVVYEEEREQH